MARNNPFTLALVGLLTLSLFAIRTEAGRSDCCLSYSKNPLPCKLIKGYSIQSMTENCNMDAILFHTVKGRTLCYDPSKAWVMARIQCLQRKVEKIVL
ncbi:C-C motif chemokine 20-like [Amia ocellicauda]|uniref:C-C motif chemokine 20-like n=1 Tax=Amia ocellicauda TaxID=2972642 RepID=UPI00346465DA